MVYPQIRNSDGCALNGESIFLLSKSGNGDDLDIVLIKTFSVS